MFDAVCLQQILFNINKAICLRLDGIEHKIEASLMQTKILDEKIQQIMIAMNQNGVSPLDVKPGSLPLRGGYVTQGGGHSGVSPLDVKPDGGRGVVRKCNVKIL